MPCVCKRGYSSARRVCHCTLPKTPPLPRWPSGNLNAVIGFQVREADATASVHAAGWDKRNDSRRVALMCTTGRFNNRRCFSVSGAVLPHAPLNTHTHTRRPPTSTATKKKHIHFLSSKQQASLLFHLIASLLLLQHLYSNCPRFTRRPHDLLQRQTRQSSAVGSR